MKRQQNFQHLPRILAVFGSVAVWTLLSGSSRPNTTLQSKRWLPIWAQPPAISTAAAAPDNSHIQLRRSMTRAAQVAAMRRVNQQFPEEVIIPTYSAFNQQTERLAVAGERFAAEPNEATFSELQETWLVAALTWSQSQAFAFGPVHSLGHEAALGSSLDEAGIDTLLVDGADLPVEDWDEISLQPSMQGFEAIAYILYAPEGSRTHEQISAAERFYLRKVTANIHETATALLNVWEAGHDSYPAYKTVLATAGDSSNRTYLSVESGTEEIVRSLMSVLDETGAETLPSLMELDSLSDAAFDDIPFQMVSHTLIGAQRAYAGMLPSAERAGLSRWVAASQSQTHEQIQAALQTAIDDFEQIITQPEAADISASLQSAQNAIETAQALLTEQVLPVTQSL